MFVLPDAFPHHEMNRIFKEQNKFLMYGDTRANEIHTNVELICSFCEHTKKQEEREFERSEIVSDIKPATQTV